MHAVADEVIPIITDNHAHHKMAAQKVVALGTKLAVGTAKTATRLGGQTMGVYKFMMVTLGLSLHSKSLTVFVCLFFVA